MTVFTLACNRYIPPVTAWANLSRAAVPNPESASTLSETDSMRSKISKSVWLQLDHRLTLLTRAAGQPAGMGR